MTAGLDALKARLDRLEGEALAYQVLLAGLLPSLSMRNTDYVARVTALAKETSASLRVEPARHKAFNDVMTAIRARLQI